MPFVSNLTGTWADAQTLTDPEYWVRHLRNPVRFSGGPAQLLQEMPDSILLEAGPGQGLCALARQNTQAAANHPGLDQQGARAECRPRPDAHRRRCALDARGHA